MNNLLLKLIENNELVHASIHTELKILKPINYDYLFATDNLGFAITMAFRMIFPINSIRILKFCVLGKHYIFTSIAKEHYNNVINKQIKLYYCNKKDFNQYKEIECKLSQSTFNLIKVPGYEYVTSNELLPNKEVNITIKNLVNYTAHNIKDNKKKIIIKALFNYLIYQKKFLTNLN
jgi:hypothetical protein